MERKSSMDSFGATALILFALLLALNQVVIKVSGGGFGPVFQAGLRSAGAVVVLLVWMRLKGVALVMPRGVSRWGLLSGLAFTFEFICLFTALDFTSVSRASVIFYSMPVWLAIAAHLFLPGERLTPLRVVGLALAMAGVIWALSNRDGADVSWQGDLAALGAALGWTSIALMVRATKLNTVKPEVQLLWQVAVSAPILLLLAYASGDLVRDLQMIHLAGLAFQIVCVASLGFLFWFWLLTLYPAASVASFSFLSPVFSVILGWVLLNEAVGLEIWGALVLVAAGIYLINRR
ncbi:DMT family transporter [Sulfitobacter sp. TBRI5]|uniref:DMT family transporter n=1 Tax=Sulfitobacter sp. TBRI5 TaxID=2989732 RepID=UPI003D9BCA66